MLNQAASKHHNHHSRVWFFKILWSAVWSKRINWFFLFNQTRLLFLCAFGGTGGHQLGDGEGKLLEGVLGARPHHVQRPVFWVCKCTEIVQTII